VAGVLHSIHAANSPYLLLVSPFSIGSGSRRGAFLCATLGDDLWGQAVPLDLGQLQRIRARVDPVRRYAPLEYPPL
jgi:hypothetical protein